jgi:hypothetical protein
MRFFLMVLVVMLAANSIGKDKKSIVAVFDVQSKRIKLSRDLLDALSDQMSIRLTEAGIYKVVPREQLKARLSKQKKKSYKQCYNQKCQIELGRELAAEKTVATKVMKLGKNCTVNIAIYDLKQATTEAAASVSGSCKEDGIVDSLNKAVDKLVGRSPESNVTSATSARPHNTKSKLIWVKSEPAGVEFTKSEVTIAQYRACFDQGQCTQPDDKKGFHQCNWDREKRDNHPVNCVDWHQAKAFCEWAGGRLPTRKEWEAEATENGKRYKPWGTKSISCNIAVYGNGAKKDDGCGEKSSWRVCAKPGGNSVSGLCDMIGNLWEWSATPDSNKGFPENRAVCGGSWRSEVSDDLSANCGYKPNFYKREGTIGFRCVRDK